MKGKWNVTHTVFGSDTMIRVFRLYDVQKVDHSGNREYAAPIFETDEDAQAYADYLNQEAIGC